MEIRALRAHPGNARAASELARIRTHDGDPGAAWDLLRAARTAAAGRAAALRELEDTASSLGFSLDDPRPGRAAAPPAGSPSE